MPLLSVDSGDAQRDMNHTTLTRHGHRSCLPKSTVRRALGLQATEIGGFVQAPDAARAVARNQEAMTTGESSLEKYRIRNTEHACCIDVHHRAVTEDRDPLAPMLRRPIVECFVHPL